MLPSIVRRLSNAAGSRLGHKKTKEVIDTPSQESGNNVAPQEVTRSSPQPQGINNTDQKKVSVAQGSRRRYTITSRNPVKLEDKAQQNESTNQPAESPHDHDLHARLAELKKCKQWADQNHASSTNSHRTRIIHDVEAFRHIPGSNQPELPPRPIASIHDLPLRHDGDIVETNIEAPTPFSTPQVTPQPIKKSTQQADVDSSFAASPAGFSLQEAESAATRIGRPRTSSRLTITSTPIEVLEQRSRSNSRSRGRSPTPQVSSTKDKKYPPVSYPKLASESDNSKSTDAATSLRADDYRRTTPSVSPHSNANTTSRKTQKPEPPATPHDKRGRPVFYSTIHYYTECSHASPPATRPLDPESQPRNDPDFHPTNPAITRSIIPGMCFNCDTSYRRTQENRIIGECTEEIARLKNNLAYLVDQLENLGYDSDEDDSFIHDRYSANLTTTCNFAEDAHDLRRELGNSSLPPLSDDDLLSQDSIASSKSRLTANERSYQLRITKQIRQIEAAIDELRIDQDMKVRAVWKGYTPRWGPATLGVQRGGRNRSESRGREFAVGDVVHPAFRTRSVSSSKPAVVHQNLDLANLRIQPDSRDDVQVIGASDGMSATVSTVSLEGRTVASCEDLLSRTDTPMTSDRNVSRGRNTTKSRASSRSTSTVSHRDVPGSRVPGEGKMRVGWIREDK